MTMVKICGITCVEDGLAAARAGADLLGFVFYPPSPRSIAPQRAMKIISAVSRAGYAVQSVGVFVDESVAHVQQITALCGLDHVQLHGSESPQLVARLARDGLSVIKAARIAGNESLRELRRYSPHFYLLDSYLPGTPGGSGATFDWRIASLAKDLGPFLLAGGLTPDNVATAVRAVRPWGVDVSTGVESSPGRKDHAKMRRFIAATKRYDRRRNESLPK